MPAFTNPADNYMRILNVSYPKKDSDILKVKKFVSNYKRIIRPKVEDKMTKFSFQKLIDTVQIYRPKTKHFSTFYQLILRNAIALKRNPAALLGRIIISIFVSLVSLTLFWDAGEKLENETDPLKI